MVRHFHILSSITAALIGWITAMMPTGVLAEDMVITSLCMHK